MTFWLMLLAASCDKESTPLPETGRPAVEVQVLAPSLPPGQRTLTGSVESWKQENVGFEVPGRVTYIIESGELARGDTYDENGVLLEKGKLLGQLDDTRYEQKVTAIEASIDAAQARAKGLEIKLKQIVPEEIRQARAQSELAVKTYQRIEGLYREGAASKSKLDDADSKLQSARAVLESALAKRATTESELNSARANVRKLKEELDSARLDLEDTRLYAPFSGQVSDTHAIPGAYVAPGVPAVTLIVMDPLRVIINVSPELDRRLTRGSRLQVRVPGLEETLDGWVYVKDAVADPVTRTYEVKVLVRNRRIPAGDFPASARGLPRIEELRRPQHRLPQVGVDVPSSSTLFVPTEALVQKDEEYYVLMAETVGDASSDSVRVLRVDHVAVTPGERRVNVLGLYVFRELKDAGRLDSRSSLVLHPDPALDSGDRVVLAPERWLLRPGDIVDVELDKRVAEPGFYVPMQAVFESQEGERFVFVIDEEQVARRMEVRVVGAEGTLQRIESDEIKTDMRVVVRGGAYLEAGDKVRIINEAEESR